MRAVTRQESWEVVPTMRETRERDIDPETGAEPVKAAAMQAMPCAMSSRGADQAMPFSASNPEAMPMIERKFTAAKSEADSMRAAIPPNCSTMGASIRCL